MKRLLLLSLFIASAAVAGPPAIPPGAPYATSNPGKFIPAQYTSYTAFGDSITAGYAASPSSNNYVSLLGTWLGVVPTNKGVSGAETADQQPLIYATTVPATSSPLYSFQIGTNEGAFYGTAANRQATFQSLHQAAIAWLSIPASRRTIGQAAATVCNVSQITWDGVSGVTGVATVTTASACGFVTGQGVTIAGAAQAGYNLTQPITVIDSTHFSYNINQTSITTPATGTITATGPGIVYGGTWAAESGHFGGSVSEVSTTNASTAKYPCFGNVCYLAYGMETSDGGTFSVTVDGTLYGTYSSNGVAGGFATTNLGATYGSALLRISGLTNGYHTVLVTVTSATSSSNHVWIDWIGGNGTPRGSQLFGGPTVLVGSPPQQGSGATTAALYGTLGQLDAGALAGDGLNVLWVDSAGAQNASTDIISDNTHPNNLGHLHIAQAYESALNVTAQGWAKSAIYNILTLPIVGQSQSGTGYQNYLSNVVSGNILTGGGSTGANYISAAGSNNMVGAGNFNSISNGGAVNTNNNFIGGGQYNSIQYGGNNAVLGGNANAVQGFLNVALGGQFAKITGSYSASVGGVYFSDQGRTTSIGTGCTNFSVAGDCQTAYTLFENTASSTTAVRLTVNKLAVSAATVNGMPATAGLYGVTAWCWAYDLTTPANTFASYLPMGTLLKTGTANSTQTWTPGTPVTLATGSTSGAAWTYGGDTTYGGLSISYTPPTSNTDTWHMVCKVQTVEIQ